jgi:transposase InsO family protein
MYLVAVIDWFSRYILAWELSNTLVGFFCQMALHQALTQGRPEIFNTDQGVQFTAIDFSDLLEQAQVLISMDGRGRALDNIFIERFWRSLNMKIFICTITPLSLIYWSACTYTLPAIISNVPIRAWLTELRLRFTLPRIQLFMLTNIRYFLRFVVLTLGSTIGDGFLNVLYT